MSTNGLIRFLGTSTAVPDEGRETASYLLDDTILIDTGWNVTERLRQHGIDPCGIGTLIFTHFHHDHYLGLPQFLFFRRMMRMRGRPTAPLRIFGPAEDLTRVFELAQDFLQTNRFFRSAEEIELVPLDPGEPFQLDAYDVKTVSGVHPVPALCYRFEHRASEAAAVICSDTAYHPSIVDLARGARLLIHEASHGARPSPSPNPSGHAGAPDAARVAKESNVDRLYLVHLRDEDRPQAFEVAQGIFSNSYLAEEGELVQLDSGGSRWESNPPVDA